MTSLARISSVPTREAVLAKIPCPVIAAIAKSFPEVEITEAGIGRASLVNALLKRGFSPLFCKLLDGALQDASRKSGKDGAYVDGDDLRKTGFFDGLTTGIFRNGFNQTRFDELMRVSKDGQFGAPELARLIRTLVAEQHPGLKAIMFTAAEYSALRQTNVGAGGKLDRDMLQAFYTQGTLTPRFHDPAFAKDLPRVAYATAKTLVCLGAQAALGLITGNADLVALTPVPGITPGVAAALAPAPATAEVKKGKCPFGHG